MKVLFYNHTGKVSGAERMMLLIMTRLQADYFEASVICPATGELSQMVRQLGYQVTHVESLQARFTWRPDWVIKYLWSFYRVIVGLRRSIAEAAPDLIHANSIRAGLVATTATLGMRVPVIWHLHDMLPRHPFSTLIRWYAVLSARTYPLAVSHAVANRFRGGVLRLLGAGDKVQVIHNGIDLQRFTPHPAARHKVRAELGLEEQQFVVGIVGQLTPRKGQLELVRAFAAALPRMPEAVLLIVGAPIFNDDDKYLDKVKRLIEELGIANRVVLTGARNDVPELMQALDLLVVNSKHEPFGGVVLEAMACGTPLLATAVDGIPEMVQHTVTGWLVPPRNERPLTDALLLLHDIPQLREDCSTIARQAVPRFSSEKYLKLIEEFYQQVRRRAETRREQELVVETQP